MIICHTREFSEAQAIAISVSRRIDRPRSAYVYRLLRPTAKRRYVVETLPDLATRRPNDFWLIGDATNGVWTYAPGLQTLI